MLLSEHPLSLSTPHHILDLLLLLPIVAPWLRSKAPLGKTPANITTSAPVSHIASLSLPNENNTLSSSLSGPSPLTLIATTIPPSVTKDTPLAVSPHYQGTLLSAQPAYNPRHLPLSQIVTLIPHIFNHNVHI